MKLLPAMPLCLQDLVDLTGGHLRLASMPPRDGQLASIERLVLDVDLVSPGSLYWCLDDRHCAAELAWLRGAFGVVTARSLEPWPGRFCLLVPDPLAALEMVIRAHVEPDQQAQLAPAHQDIFPPAHHKKPEPSTSLPELKGLQLCAGERVAIYSPTCGRPANERMAHRCRRRAA